MLTIKTRSAVGRLLMRSLESVRWHGFDCCPAVDRCGGADRALSYGLNEIAGS